MIFITLGSQKFQFNRLLKKIDELIADGTVAEEVFAQIGYSDYQPQNYGYTDFLDKSAFSDSVQKADLIITHGGTGAVLGAVKQGKKVIAVPRLSAFGEHVDDHQLQLVSVFDEMGIAMACNDVEHLAEVYLEVRKREFKPYVSNTETIIRSIEEYLETLFLA